MASTGGVIAWVTCGLTAEDRLHRTEIKYGTTFTFITLLYQILTDFQNSFTSRVSNDYVTNLSLT